MLPASRRKSAAHSGAECGNEGKELKNPLVPQKVELEAKIAFLERTATTLG
jgi:hypothetical protein